MKYQRILVLIVSCFSLLFVAACHRTDKAAPSRPKQKEAKSGEKSLSELYAQFVEVRMKQPVDFDALAEIYTGKLSDFVIQADDRFQKSMDGEVIEALEFGKNGKEPLASAQRAEKSIQRAFILFFREELDRLTGTKREEPFKTSGEGAAELKTDRRYFEQAVPVVRTIVQRRSEGVGKGDEYVVAFNALVENIKSAGASSTEKSKSAAQCYDLLVKAIALSVFYELEGLEKARGDSTEKAAEKRMECLIYYRSLLDEHRLRNKADANAVSEQLQKPAEEIDLKLVRELLFKSFEKDLSGVKPSLLGLAK